MDLLQIAANLGVGAFLATLIFIFAWRTARLTEEHYHAEIKAREERLNKVLDAYNAATTENTKILSELYTYLRIKNGGK